MMFVAPVKPLVLSPATTTITFTSTVPQVKLIDAHENQTDERARSTEQQKNPVFHALFKASRH